MSIISWIVFASYDSGRDLGRRQRSSATAPANCRCQCDRPQIGDGIGRAFLGPGWRASRMKRSNHAGAARAAPEAAPGLAAVRVRAARWTRQDRSAAASAPARARRPERAGMITLTCVRRPLRPDSRAPPAARAGNWGRGQRPGCTDVTSAGPSAPAQRSAA